MSSIHARTVVGALDRPSTLKALTRKTGYSEERVLNAVQEARRSGHTIQCVGRPDAPSFFRLLEVAQ